MRRTIGTFKRVSRRSILYFGLMTSVSVGLVACSAPEQTKAAVGAAQQANANQGKSEVKSGGVDNGVRTSEGGSMTLKVTWSGREAGPVFKVAMDTHAVDLDTVDLGKSAVLRINQGQDISPSGWEAPMGGHHREGILSFPKDGNDGTPLIGPSTRIVELIVRDVAGVPERTLRWDLQS